jgi:hypothetical protein
VAPRRLTLFGSSATPRHKLLINFMLQRCYRRERSDIARSFRELYKEHAEHVRLDEHILDTWATYFTAALTSFAYHDVTQN